MFLKYLIPFDRFVVETPLSVEKVHERLATVTVKRSWRHAFRGTPGTFEGTLKPGRFTLLTSAEPWSLSRQQRLRNTHRPVCTGKIESAATGSRIIVSARPPAVTIAIMAFLILMSAGTIRLMLEHAGEVDAAAAFGLPAMFLTFYVLLGIPFWRLRRNFKAALERVLA